MRMIIKTLLCGTALAGLALTGVAQAQNVAVGLAAAPTSVDPHYHNLSPNNALASHIYGTLVRRDASNRTMPSLALSWKLIDDTTWEFKLRPGVTFHNGGAFTADDVVYSIARPAKVLNSPGSFAVYSRPVQEVQVVDPLTVRMKTAELYPLLPIDLSVVQIVPASLGPNATTEDFNNGKNAIGTGPFRLTAYRSGDRAELTRNDGYWGEKPHWQNVSYRFLVNNGARVAALLAGDVALIEAVPTTEVAMLRKDPKIAISEVNSSRIVFLWFDHSRTGPTPFVKGPNGEELAKNPFLDLRVRQALSMAINRPAIVDRVMENAAIAAGQLLPPGSYSYVPGLNPTAYDPQKAKALLAEAGFPNGFRVTLHGPNDRYVNDAKIIQAVGQMWTRIGVQTQVEALPWASYSGRGAKQEWSMGLWGWGSGTGEAGYTLINVIGTFDRAAGRGTSNNGRHSNPAIDALTDKALSTLGDEDRETLLRQGVAMAMNEVAFIPMYQLINFWAHKIGRAHV